MNLNFTSIECIKKDSYFEMESIKLEKELFNGKINNAKTSQTNTRWMFVIVLIMLAFFTYQLQFIDISNFSKIEVVFSALAFPSVILFLGFLFDVHSKNYKEIKDNELMVKYLDDKLKLLEKCNT